VNFVQIIVAVLTICTSLTFAAGEAQTGRFGDQSDGTFRNPILAADYSDPDACCVGSDFYMVASTFESSPGVTVLHSKDLVNWTAIEAAIPDLAKLGPNFNWDRMRKYNERVYAPSIHFHDGADHWSLTERPGFLRLHAWPPLKPDVFFTAGNTIGQRFFRSNQATMTIKLDLNGLADGQHAGFAHYNGGKTYAAISVIQAATPTQSSLRGKWRGGGRSRPAHRPTRCLAPLRCRVQ
jgi:beta-xylosidase